MEDFTEMEVLAAAVPPCETVKEKETTESALKLKDELIPIEINYTKILMLGDSCCGKSWFCCSFTDNILPFRGDNFIAKDYLVEVYVDGISMPCELCDTEVRSNYCTTCDYKQTDVILLCFSIDDKKSLSNVIDKWIKEINSIRKGLPIILVGMKNDLRNSQQNVFFPEVEQNRDKLLDLVTSEEAEIVKEKLGLVKYMECSGLTNNGVRDVVVEAVKESIRFGLTEKGGGNTL